MKLVAKVQFHNAPELNLQGKDNKPLDLIPKGHEFEISPGTKALKAVTKESDKQVISKLVMFGLVVVDDDTPESKDAIKAIKAEVEVEKKVAEVAAKNVPLSVADLIASGVAAALNQLGIKPAEAKK
jgi:hypothetical protein